MLNIWVWFNSHRHIKVAVGRIHLLVGLAFPLGPSHHCNTWARAWQIEAGIVADIPHIGCKLG